MVNETFARKQYKLLSHANQTEIRIFGSNANPGKYSYFVSDEDEFIQTLKDLDNKQTSIGVGINERNLNGTTDDDVKALRLLVLDLDSTEPTDKQKVEDYFKIHHIPIAAIVHSGSKGYHYYIKTITITEPEEIKRALANAKHALVGPDNKNKIIPIDHTIFNPSRIFRAWGTTHPATGQVTTLLEYNPDAPFLDLLSHFPEAPVDTSNRHFANQTNKHRSQVVASCAFVDAYLDGKVNLQVPKQGASFNNIFVPNVIAYARYKRIQPSQLYRQVKGWQGYGPDAIKSWERTADLEFNYAALRANVKEHYPKEYAKYYQKETQDHSNNLRYTDPNEFKGNQKEYKDTYRESQWFTITDHWSFKARVITYDSPQELITLADVYGYREKDITAQGADNYYRFFDEPPIKPKHAEQLGLFPFPKQLKTNLYTFTAIDRNNQQWTIFSEQKLDGGDYTLYGTRFDVQDKLKVGNVANVSSAKRVLLLHSFEKEEHTIDSFEELYERIPFTTKELREWLMTDFSMDPSPTYDPGATLGTMYMAWAFSGKADNDRQLNLCIMGPPGSGKTPQITSIAQKFGEETIGGVSMTIKGLTVSFFGNEPRPGAFLKAIRVLPIDEFFKILNNRNLDGYEDLTSLNSVLDSATFTAESGKYTIRVKPTCRMITASNHIHERFTGSKSVGARMTFARMCQVLPSDFMGRIMFVIQTKEEYRAVTDGKRISYNERTLSISHRDWLAAYDFINEQAVTNVDDRKLREITKAMTMPDAFGEVYAKSCTRNAKLIFAGLVKIRCFDEKRKEFAANQHDYKTFEALWKELHTRWLEGDVPKDPLTFLTEDEQEMLKFIQDAKETTWYEVQKATNMTPELRDRLRLYGFIYYDSESKRITTARDSVNLE